jgi:teichuronic acid biosynthesis glycosyltransferase TuaC
VKAAWVHSFPPAPAASGVFMHQLADAMRRRGTDVRLISAGNQVRSWRLLRPNRATRAAAAACDLVHAQYGSGCSLFASRLRGPKVLTLRGSDWYGGGPRSLRSHLRSTLTRTLTRRALRCFDLVITVSNRMAADVLRAMPGMHCTTLPSGIDLDRFQPFPREAARLALDRGDDADPWILFASALDGNPVKRPWLAAAAVDELRRRRPTAKLVTLTGRPHTEVPLWVAASDVLILTSTHEGWPNIVKEALACNVPFVSTDVSDLAGIAAAEESCHVAAADPVALASCLDQALASLRSDGLRRHVLGFDLDQTASSLQQLYAKVTAGRS